MTVSVPYPEIAWKWAMDSALSPPVPTQAVQYADDAVEVTYSDGSQLALSPCGAAFQHTKPIGRDQHPLTG